MTNLGSWSSSHQKRIVQMIEDAKQESDSFAVFDADNTIWTHDLTEALLCWLEKKKMISLSGFAPELLPIPPKSKESLFGYYERLGELLGHSSSYLWSAQAFQGISLEILRIEIKKLLSTADPLEVGSYEGGEYCIKKVAVPRLIPAQLELIAELQRNGIAVWVVSASLEELVRMVVSDPLFGVNIPPERVIGVNMLIKGENDSIWASAQHREAGMIGEAYFSAQRLAGVLTHHLYAPGTWYAGKVAAIQEWIHPTKRPILVAGDSPNDFYMQFYSNATAGGMRLRIHRSQAHKEQLEKEKQRREESKSATFDPHIGWLEVSF